MEEGSVVMARCPRGTVVQSVLVSRHFMGSAREAAAWVRKHKFRATKVDTTENFHRFRQFDPSMFVPGTFRTIVLRTGVEAVIGCPRREIVGR
jgi:hypothetical protein